MFHFWWRRGQAAWGLRAAGRGRRPGARQCRPVRPWLECLEGRCLLSTYSIVDLGTLGGSGSLAYGINASGQVVGWSYTAGNAARHAFLYDGTTMHDLGTLGGSDSLAYGINASGQVVGTSNPTGTALYHAFLYDGTSMRDLGTLGGGQSTSEGINTSGQVVGWSTTTAGFVPAHAFLYDGTTMKDLGTLGGTNSYAGGINDSGQVAGESQPAGTASYHVFLYDGTAMKDLGNLGGRNSNAYVGPAINASGQMAGTSEIAAGNSAHAFLYDGTALKDLGTLGGPQSIASGLNNSGQVVGQSETATSGGVYYAFFYDGTAMYDLNGLIPTGTGWVLNEASAINDNGQIAGYGTINGQTHAFLLTPISPATSFQVTAPASAVAGAPFNITVTALDASGHVATGYTGTVHFTSADPYGATLPADYTFTAADHGVRTFTAGATLYTAGTWDVTGTDTASGITGSASVQVTPAPAVQFVVTAPSQTTSGVPFDVTVTAVDPYGNTDTNYQGTVTFSTTDPDPGVVLPADYTFTAADRGTHTFSGGFTLVTPGDQTLTAVDTVNNSLSGSAVVTVGSPAPGAGSPRLAGQPQLIPSPGSAPRAGGPSPAEVAPVDRLFASLSMGNAGFVLSRPVHHARGSVGPWAPGPLGADEPLFI
jgi:probable HAF family extracellular repeat protein